jgi:ABC-type transport system involved in multi-copper enzyme maturation permease subunit
MSAGVALAQGEPAADPALRAPRIPLARLVHVELRKMADTRAGLWLLAAIALITVGVAVIYRIAAPRTFTETFRALQWPVGTLLPVLGILSVTSEWSQRTALTTFTLVPNRWRVILAKALAIVALAVAAVALAAVVAAIANLFAPADGGWSLSAATLGEAIAFQLFGLFAGLAFGLMLQASAPAIVLYYVLPTALSVLVALVDSLTEPAKWFSISDATTPLVDGGASATQWAQLATSAAIWVGGALLVGLYRLSRSELK